MGFDPFSPIAPARVNVLAVPAGRVKQSRFADYVKRIQKERVVRLSDVSTSRQPIKNLFSPSAFPDGHILYHISDSEHAIPSVESFPFELNREPQLILALADGNELEAQNRESAQNYEATNYAILAAFHSLRDDFRASQAQYGRAFVQQLVIFDVPMPIADTSDISFVSPKASVGTTVKTVMCDVTARFLSGLDDLARHLQRLATIDSPHTISLTQAKDRAKGLADRVRQRMSPSTGRSPDLCADSKRNRSPSARGKSQSPATSSGNVLGRRSPASSPSSTESLSLGQGKGSREPSRDQVLSVRFGVTSLIEVKQGLSKGRYRVTIGAMYLQAGKWPDALRELTGGVLLVSSNKDFIWHARGLELLLACMLMFCWARMSFQIPAVCYAALAKSSISKAAPALSDTSNLSAEDSSQMSSSHGSAVLQNFTKLVPDFLSVISQLYTQASASTPKTLPHLLLREAKVRAASLLAVMHLQNGSLDDQGMAHIILQDRLEKADFPKRISKSSAPQRHDLSAMLLGSAPEPFEEIPLSDTVTILVAIAAIMSQLGLERKEAFIMKEMLLIIMPALADARKSGAAEMGIHPAAGLSAILGVSDHTSLNIQRGVRTLLTSVAHMYGIPYSVDRPVTDGPSTSVEAIAEGVQRWAYAKSVGDYALKTEILKSCIGICEALPDFHGFLIFTVHLLQMARRAITLSPSYRSDAPVISQDDQKYLLSNLKRTVVAAANVGLLDVQAQYWDDFLVRGIQLLEPKSAYRLIPHSARDLQIVDTLEDGPKKDPFIYNPFLKTARVSDGESVLIAGEIAYFAVTLQNPFEFEVEIEHISLLTDSDSFHASPHSVVLGPFCSQEFVLSGKPMADGILKVKGCRVKVRYCHERTFYIFAKPWEPRMGHKVKPSRRMAGRKSESTLGPPGSSSSQESQSDAVSLPEVDVLSIKVLSAQPLISLQSCSLSQPALMVLEGESQQFQISLRNESKSVSADLLLFTYQDSATQQLQSALTGKQLSPAEIYELQLQLAGKPSLRWVQQDDGGGEPSIPPEATLKIKFEVFGKPGLLNGVIHIDYAFLDAPRSQVKDMFYTRQICFPVAITVNAGVELPRCNVLPFSGDFAWINQQNHNIELRSSKGDRKVSVSGSRSRPTSRDSPRKEKNQFASLLARLGLGSHGDDHCLLVLDLRNAWPFPLSVSIQVRENVANSSSPSDPWRRAYTVHEVLQPGHVSRIVLLLPRIYIRDPRATVPLIGDHRQFVVNGTKLPPEAEAANREAFWFREELLQYIRGTWQDDVSGRHGIIDFRRGIRLSSNMVEAMKIDDIEISFSVAPLSEKDKPNSLAPSPSVRQIGKSHFILLANTFATLSIKVHNRSTDRIRALLRLQPSIRNQRHNIALDLSKRFAWTGMLQRALHPPLEPGGIRVAELGIAALCAGNYEVGASVEEVRAIQQPTKENGAPQSAFQADRRIWHGKEPCLIDAVDDMKT